MVADRDETFSGMTPHVKKLDVSSDEKVDTSLKRVKKLHDRSRL